MIKQFSSEIEKGVDVIFHINERAIEIVGVQVTARALYSFCKEQWRDNFELIRYKFPMKMEDLTSYILNDGWSIKNDNLVIGRDVKDCINDSDYLNRETDIKFDLENKTIELIDKSLNSESNIKSGVSIYALWAFCMELWKTDDEFLKYGFPIYYTFDEFNNLYSCFMNSWKPKNQKTIDLIVGGFVYEEDDSIQYCHTDFDTIKGCLSDNHNRFIYIMNTRIEEDLEAIEKSKNDDSPFIGQIEKWKSIIASREAKIVGLEYMNEDNLVDYICSHGIDER